MNNMLKTHGHLGAPEMLVRWHRTSQMGAGPEYNRFMLRVGRTLELTEEGILFVRALVEVGYVGVMGHAFLWETRDQSARVGSVEAERLLETTAAAIGDQLPLALDAFVERVPTAQR